LIDVDECGFELSKTNRGDGHGFIGLRLRKPGHYTRNTKITVIMGIEAGDPTLPDNVYGSLHHPRRLFVEFVCSDIEETLHFPNDSHRYFLWDNLAAHGAGLVYQTVQVRANEACRFGIVKRPPYQPKFGPIEFIFCELSCRLRQLSRPDWTNDILCQEILNVAAQLGFEGKFNNTFEHCGYAV
jgi:hypothetical protein